MNHRTTLHAVAVATVGLTAGCSAVSDAVDSVVLPPGPPDVAEGPGEYPHAIHVENDTEQSKTVTITVRTDDSQGSVLYEGTHTVAAGIDQVVAGFTQKRVREEHQGVVVTAAMGETTDSVRFGVDDCHGDIYVTLDPDEGLHVIYAIC